MKKILYTLLMTILFINLFSQKEAGKLYKIYYYKTYDDFFSGKKKFLGKSEKVDGDSFKMIDTITGKKFKVNLRDSSFAGYTHDDYNYCDKNSKRIFDSRDKAYYTFLTGNKHLAVYYSSNRSAYGEFDSNGEMISGSFIIGDGSFMAVVKELDFSKRHPDFAVQIKDNQKLYDQFKEETTSSKEAKQTYSGNFIEVQKRYIKLYCEQLQKK